MFIIIIQAKGALNCTTQYVGPFPSYMAAEDAFVLMPAAIDCEVKFIEKLQSSFDHAEFEAAKTY